jgi:hypothetical protein
VTQLHLFVIGGGGLKIFKNFAASAAVRLHLFLIGGGSADRLTPPLPLFCLTKITHVNVINHKINA